jgi:hypothetical protein
MRELYFLLNLLKNDRFPLHQEAKAYKREESYELHIYQPFVSLMVFFKSFVTGTDLIRKNQ